MRHKVTNDHFLIDELILMFPNTSTTKIRKMLTNNRVELNGEITNQAKKEITKGSIIVIKDKIKKILIIN